jgi:ABC-2 type transport system permease protein
MGQKELIQVLRDPRSLAIVVVMPVVLMLLFGYGVNLDQKHIPVCVLDREGSQQSQALLKRFQSMEYFEIACAARSYPEVVSALDSGKAKLGFVIPSDFSEQLAKGGPVAVQAVVDAADDNSANIIMGYTESIVRSFSSDVQLGWLQRAGRAAPNAPFSMESRVWYNEDLQSIAFIVPGVLALVMAVIGAFLTSLTIAREWERGTMEQLISTPVTALEVMLGKLGPYFVIGMFATGLCAMIGIFWFDVPFRGSAWTLLGCSALFLIVVLSQGYVMSVIAKSQLAASQAALISTFLPAFLLSGFLFSIENMPRPIQVFTNIIPAKFYVSLLKAIFLKGSPVALLMVHLVPLAIFSLILAAIATRAFKKRLA